MREADPPTGLQGRSVSSPSRVPTPQDEALLQGFGPGAESVTRVRKMPGVVTAYVRLVDRLSLAAGIVAMVLTFVLLGLLVESSLARVVFGVSHIWSVEMAMFTMSAYYLLGGALSEKDDYHVRMDLVYGRLSPRARAIVDCLTAPLLIFYLAFLFVGGISSSHWAVVNQQVNYSPWAPPMAPIKIIMTVGIGLMLMQIIAVFFKDLAKALGRSIE